MVESSDLGPGQDLSCHINLVLIVHSLIGSVHINCRLLLFSFACSFFESVIVDFAGGGGSGDVGGDGFGGGGGGDDDGGIRIGGGFGGDGGGDNEDGGGVGVGGGGSVGVGVGDGL